MPDDAGRPVLAVSDLGVTFPSAQGEQAVVRGISYAIGPRQTLGVVGESGSGKTMAALALLGLVPRPGRITGEVRFDGSNLVGAPEPLLRALRADRIAMLF